MVFLCHELSAQQNKSDTLLNLKNTSYSELALLGGGPTVINFSGSIWFKPVGIRVSGGYFETEMNGIQFNLNYKIKDNVTHRHSIGLAFGKSQDRGCEYSYFGPVYDFTYKKFFIEFGVCKVIHVERGDFSDLPYWIIFQIGYVYRFTNKAH